MGAPTGGFLKRWGPSEPPPCSTGGLPAPWVTGFPLGLGLLLPPCLLPSPLTDPADPLLLAILPHHAASFCRQHYCFDNDRIYLTTPWQSLSSIYSLLKNTCLSSHSWYTGDVKTTRSTGCHREAVKTNSPESSHSHSMPGADKGMGNDTVLERQDLGPVVA